MTDDPLIASERALYADLEVRTEQLRSALMESLILQSHYAVLLNRFDDGNRMTFPTIASWLERLRAIGRMA